ncbi:MAG TPA: cbb3-type cytochrome c oxidase subunit 3 [Beijerinckiaceae bacterium]|jgi:cbb3-type cytochrome oxidase subunit 3
MTLQSFFYEAKAISLVVVTVTFALIVAYAMWPSLQGRFDEAARLPLNED